MFVSFQFPMKKLKRKKEVTVYLPDDYYYSDYRYPVLYIQDGQNAFFDRLSYSGVSWGFFDYVKENDPPLIMVAIPCEMGPYKREDEYGPWPISEELSYHETHIKGKIIGGEGKEYVEWMIHELKPYIDQRFRTDINDSAIVGSSMGGIIAAYAALSHSDVFHKCAALSTAFWFYNDEFAHLIEETDLSELTHFYFDLGEFEGCGDEEIDEWYIESNDFIYSLLKEKTSNLNYCFYEGAVHNESAWRARLDVFMKYLYEE